VDPVEEAIRKIKEMEDPYTTNVAEAMVYVLSLENVSEPKVTIESVVTAPHPRPEPTVSKTSLDEPILVKGSVVEVGMLSVEGWAGSAALLVPYGAATLFSTRPVQSVHFEPEDGTFELRHRTEGTHVLLKDRLVVWEGEGPVQRAIWHVYGSFEQTNKGYGEAFAASEPFAKVTGPVLVRLFWAREGNHDTTGDLAPKSALVERLGLLTSKGPEFTLVQK